MKTYTESVDSTVCWKVWDNIIHGHDYNTIMFNVVITHNVVNTVWNNVGRNVQTNLTLFQNNSLKQYKDNI
jgi:hypothetical protein